MVVNFFNLLLLLLCLIINQFVRNNAWMLAHIGLNASYQVLHLSTHFTRVYLSITVQNHTFPTFIETQWPKSYLNHLPPTIYPHRYLHASGDHTDCRLMQQARWSRVDALSRLWVMDQGWLATKQQNDSNCNPKLMVFDLLRNNVEVLHIDCGQYISPNAVELLDIEFGPRISACGSEKYIYFVLATEPHLLAYDILEQTWHYRELKSKKYTNINEFLTIQPQDLAFGSEGEFLVSDSDGNLFTAPNKMNHVTKRSHDKSDVVMNMSLLGALLGPTRDMMVDQYGALFYVVKKFGAVVRCVYKQNITAEDNEIIYMTSKNIQQIFFGSDGSVWLLSKKWLKPDDKWFFLPNYPAKSEKFIL